MSTLVIIPAYNEEESIIATVEELREQAPQYDYVIINDGRATGPPNCVARADTTSLTFPQTSA